ncbi:protein BCCIP homolog isoform X2 [Coffea eugenioides]|nr:protein BCCIP homolog isoform X2 [Coffea arabica]XP_027122901.1 protein BCCIP homolog isoform X2 [Coffea arabica]XP_027168642.1 protein BCCIP homolog isoform X2 [Coffea eugenioides]
MPRKPRRRRQRPVSFSPFGRSMAFLYPTKKMKHQILDSVIKDMSAPSTSDVEISANGVVKDGTFQNHGETSDSSDDGEFDGVVQADFSFFDPKPDDFNGVKVLLQTYMDDKLWDLSGFVDLILGQTTVGTVVKIEDDEDEGVYAFVTALNMGRYKDHKCMIELKEFLLKSCKEDSVSNLRSLLGEKAQDVGLLVSQRVVNLPPQLLPPLYDALFDEVSWATEDEPTEELQKSFCFKSYLMISKIYKHKNANKKMGKSGDREEDIIYSKPEDELFDQLSSWSFSFPLHTQQVTANELKDYRPMGLVMAVDASKVGIFRKQLHSLIDES